MDHRRHRPKNLERLLDGSAAIGHNIFALPQQFAVAGLHLVAEQARAQRRIARIVHILVGPPPAIPQVLKCDPLRHDHQWSGLPAHHDCLPLVASGLVSITLFRCSLTICYGPRRGRKRTTLRAEGFGRWYRGTIGLAIEHRWKVLAFSSILLAFGGFSGNRLLEQFFRGKTATSLTLIASSSAFFRSM